MRKIFRIMRTGTIPRQYRAFKKGTDYLGGFSLIFHEYLFYFPYCGESRIQISSDFPHFLHNMAGVMEPL
jgi:hypothetical protein